MLFKSQIIPGAVLNRFGVALIGGSILDAELASQVQREAIAAGWHKVPAKNKDEGLVFSPPKAPDDGKRIQ